MPVRQIPRSHSSLTGRRAIGGTRNSVGFESSLERDFVILMQFDPNVVSIEEQPVCITYFDRERRERRYTPDYLVEFANRQPILVEVKPRKFLRDQLPEKFDAARQYSRGRSWRFQIWTEREIRIERLENARFLLPFQRRAAAQDVVPAVLDAVQATRKVTIGQLLSAVRAPGE